MSHGDDTYYIDFEQWLLRVDELTYARTGYSVHDLPEKPCRERFDAGDTPEQFFDGHIREDRVGEVQLALGFPRPAVAAESEWTIGPVDRSGVYAYLHLIRSADDPQRRPRPPGGQKDRQPHLTIDKTSPATWAARLQELLGDGMPRTFNRIGVELLDKTADVIFGTSLDDALWALVDQGVIEHTWVAPVLFRLRQAGEAR
jgi:hypothetical protein